MHAQTLLFTLLLVTSALVAPVAAADSSSPAAVGRIEGTFLEGRLDQVLAHTPAGVLVPFYERQSVAFDNVRYHQVLDGVRIHGTGASEHTLLRDPTITLSHADLVPVGAPTTGQFRLSHEQAIATAEDGLGLRLLLPGFGSSAEQVWYPDTHTLRAAYAVEVPAMDPLGTWRIVVDATSGDVLEVDALSEGFDPDQPLTGAADLATSLPGIHPHSVLDAVSERVAPATAELRSAAPRADYPATVHQVSPIVAMQQEDFRDNAVGIDDGSFDDGLIEVTIEGLLEAMPLQTDRTWVVDALTVPVAGLPLDFRRDDPRFQELMVLHYVEVAQNVMEANGYEQLFPGDHVRAISRVPSPLPNALATQVDGQGYIVFFYRAPTQQNPGFATSSEDAEVVVHELGHLIHFETAPNAGGAHRGAWAEGSADFYASLLLEGEGLSEGFGDPCVGEWFTSYLAQPVYEGLPCIRVLDNDLQYPDDATGSGHFNGQFWSGPNWEIRQEIGRNASLVLFTEANFLTPSNIANFTVLADTVLHADCALTECQRESLIRESFQAKNITTSPLPEAFQAMTAPQTGDGSEESERGIPAPTMVILVAALLGVVWYAQRRRDW